jgi:hypothetical protein
MKVYAGSQAFLSNIQIFVLAFCGYPPNLLRQNERYEVTSPFKIRHDELVSYGEAVLRMYKIAAIMLKSDFGRLNPVRAHELARRAARIPDHASLGRVPLGEWEESPEGTL